MNVLIASPIEEAVERCIACPGYRVGIIVSNREEKYSMEDAVGKAVFFAYLKKAGGEHQFTRFYKTELGFKCEFIDGGSIIDCIILENNDAVRGRRYNMLVSPDEFDDRTKTMISPCVAYEFVSNKRESDSGDNKNIVAALDNLSNVVTEMYNMVRRTLVNKD